MRYWNWLTCMILLGVSPAMLSAADLISFKNIKDSYIGGFKIKYSDSLANTNFSNAQMAIDVDAGTVFFSSHAHQDAVAEFQIPTLATNATDMTLATNIQPFVQLHNRAEFPTDQGLDQIRGMAMVDGKLYVQYALGYDATEAVTDTTIIVDNPRDLDGSQVRGFFQMDGAARVSSYISKIPTEWQSKLGGSYLAGNGDGMSIVGRLSNGPSLYSFLPHTVLGNQGRIPTIEHQNYPKETALSTTEYSIPEGIDQVEGYAPGWDSFNLSGLNNLWTESAAAIFGFIIPGTRTFAAIGRMGMHNSGGGYKIIQDNGFLCGGPCPNKYDDWDSYYWLYDLDEILAATNPWDTIPYEIGVFDNRFLTPIRGNVVGLPYSGSWDPENNRLYITYNHGSGSDRYAPHVVAAYDLSDLVVFKPSSPPGLIDENRIEFRASP